MVGNGRYWRLIFSDYCHFKNIPDALIRKIMSKIHSAGYIYLLNVTAYLSQHRLTLCGSLWIETASASDHDMRYISMEITRFM